MTAERDTVSVGSCPACGGPAQFIADTTCPTCSGAGWVAATTADPLPSGEPGEPYQVQQTCDDCGGAGRLPSLARHVALPNIDEDLGGGWVLRDLKNRGLLARPERRWVAEAHVARPSGGPDMEYGFAATPSAAYLALRTAIEARP